MSLALHALLTCAVTALIGGVSVVAFQLATVPPVRRPRLGNRGLKRAAAIQQGGLFSSVEPLIRYGAAWSARTPLEPIRRPLTRDLKRAGDHLGMSADELLAVSAALTLLGSVLAVGASASLGLPRLSIPMCALLSGVSPWLRVRAIGRARATRVTRSLPAVIDLVAMCMGAGLDFPGSVRRTVGSAPDGNEPIVEELRRVLQELEVGRTRREALADFAERVPSDEVRELVNSLVQAEAKGSPIAHVLGIQAQTLRLRRSIAAEESASEAALMLVGPMTMIFACVIVLLLGPVVVRVMSGGFGAV